MEMERHEVEGTLWVYVVDAVGRTPVREVTWLLRWEEQELRVDVGRERGRNWLWSLRGGCWSFCEVGVGVSVSEIMSQRR